MKKLKYILSFLSILFISNLYALEITQKTTNISVLKDSKIFFDHTNSLTKGQIKDEDFRSNKEEVLVLGFLPHSAVWVKFTLTNTTKEPITKILEYANPETEKILFYDGERVLLDGMWNMPKGGGYREFKSCL